MLEFWSQNNNFNHLTEEHHFYRFTFFYSLAHISLMSGECEGESEVTETCNDDKCPAWTNWTDWTECSKVNFTSNFFCLCLTCLDRMDWYSFLNKHFEFKTGFVL